MALITSQELKKRIADDPKLVIIDIRSEAEVADGMIPKAIWMDVSSKEFMAKISAMSKDVPYCIYCASGGRTMMVVPFMEANGFEKVYELDGGIFEWIAEGNATE
jgi:rhodanese-related sulfurtransferase